MPVSAIKVLAGTATLASPERQGGHEAAEKMKNGLYSVTAAGLDGIELPNGVVVLLNGVCFGGGPYTYYTGSYSYKDGIFKGECVVNQHTSPPVNHLFFNAKDIGMGVTGTYAGDQAVLTATILVGKRSLAFQMILRKLADI